MKSAISVNIFLGFGIKSSFFGVSRRAASSEFFVFFKDFQMSPKTQIAKSDATFLSGSAELDSEHPLGEAIVAYARRTLSHSDDPLADSRSDFDESNLSRNLVQPKNFEAISGRGLRCIVDNRSVIIGNRAWMKENDISVTNWAERTLLELETQVRKINCHNIAPD